MTSEKLKKLEIAQLKIVQNTFVVDQENQTSPMICDYFRKMKPLGVSRVFSDYNKRYFSFNLSQLIIYYTPNKIYSLNNITYLPFEEVREIRDKPHYAISNQGIEWKDVFGLTIYFNDRYMVLVTQNINIYNKWLDQFESVKWRNTGQSILRRDRTQYLRKSFIANIVHQQIETKPDQQIVIESPKEFQQYRNDEKKILEDELYFFKDIVLDQYSYSKEPIVGNIILPLQKQEESERTPKQECFQHQRRASGALKKIPEKSNQIPKTKNNHLIKQRDIWQEYDEPDIPQIAEDFKIQAKYGDNQKVINSLEANDFIEQEFLQQLQGNNQNQQSLQMFQKQNSCDTIFLKQPQKDEEQIINFLLQPNTLQEDSD